MGASTSMSAVLGPAPIVDFDGTIARLPVDWAGLRDALGVSQISRLWDIGGLEGFSLVTDAEVESAKSAEPVRVILDTLGSTQGFAVLTSNSALAVQEFFRRFPSADALLACVVGREQLGGPKTDFGCFSRGLEHCLTATEAIRAGAPRVYVGDSRYELGFARRLGVTAIHVSDLVSCTARW